MYVKIPKKVNIVNIFKILQINIQMKDISTSHYFNFSKINHYVSKILI